MASLGSILIFVVCLLCLLLTGNAKGTCQMTDFGRIEREYRSCASGHPSVADLDRYQASGAQLVAIFWGFCGDLDDIISCVRDEFRQSGCSDSDFQAFTTRAEKSTYFCHNGDIKPFIADIFQGIPSVGSYGSSDPCTVEARRGSQTCRDQAVAASLTSGVHVGLEGFVRLITGTMSCTFEHVTANAHECPRQESLLTVSLYYGGVVVPPQLGVNVSQILLSMAGRE